MSTISYRASQPPVNPAVEASPGQEGRWLGISLGTWIKIASLTALFAMLFWPNLRRLWEKTNPVSGDDNWKHGLFVPLIGLYYLYVNRDLLQKAQQKPAWSGMVVTLAGLLFFTYGIYPGQNDWFKDIGMVATLFGLVLLLWGWQVMKIAWFPIVFLVCALPWPGLFYSLLAGPLQKLAATVAVRLLGMSGVPARQFGTKIFIEGSNHVVRTLNVAEACAGLRSLMSFIAIAGAVAFLSFRPLWQKILMVLSAIPIAIFCNTMRITVQGLFDGYVSHQWSESFAHGFLGLAMMIPAFFLILLVGWVLQNILIEEVEKKTIRAPQTANRAGIATGARTASTIVRRGDPPRSATEGVRTTAAVPSTRPAPTRRPAAVAPVDAAPAPLSRPPTTPAARPGPAARPAAAIPYAPGAVAAPARSAFAAVPSARDMDLAAAAKDPAAPAATRPVSRTPGVNGTGGNGANGANASAAPSAGAKPAPKAVPAQQPQQQEKP